MAQPPKPNEVIQGDSSGWTNEMPKLPPSFAAHARICAGNPLPEDLAPRHDVTSDVRAQVSRLEDENKALRSAVTELRSTNQSLIDQMKELMNTVKASLPKAKKNATAAD